MRFLLTNDDGIHSRGIKTLAECLSTLGCVTVVAPETERSAIAHAINVSIPIRVRKVSSGAVSWYGCNGTPADCVKIGVKYVLKKKPDWVVSGINHGANLGLDIFYSGTVSAAIEGAILGIPSVAVSLAGKGRLRFDVAGDIFLGLFREISRKKFPADVLLNVNIPNLPPDKQRGLAVTVQSRSRFHERYERRKDPKGNPYYWLTGSFKLAKGERNSDAAAVAARCVSLTPLCLNLTHRDFLRKMSMWYNHRS